MLTILYIFGLRFFFYSEEHLPIHIHVQNADGRAKINVLTYEIMDNKGIKTKDLRQSVEIVRQYKEEIIKAWNKYFDE